MNLTPFAAATKKYNVRGISWDSAGWLWQS